LAAFFVDSSALAKRYTNEAGTTWVRSWTRTSAGNLIVISELALVELFSTLARRQYTGDITPRTADRLRNVFLAHVRDDYSVIDINGSLIAVAQTLVTKHVALGLRTLDASSFARAVIPTIADEDV
jgi:predicted nucleic acid-binding protein